MANIRNSEKDPFKGQLLDQEIITRGKELKEEFSSALTEEGSSIINLKNVFFQTGSSLLQDQSKYELNELATLLKANGNVKVELGGHTDSQGDDGNNQILSQDRAQSVLNFLRTKGVIVGNMTARGYGENSPVETNETPEGRQANRRTELKIISK